MMAALAAGSTRPAPTPRAGQTAPNRQAQVQRPSFGAEGREPRSARMRVSVPCWPMRASSCHQVSIGLPIASGGRAAVATAAKFA